MPNVFHVPARRTARVCTLGEASASSWWVLLHGYGHLASRFLERAAALGEDDRLLIAPEALSRFYVDRMQEHQSVGASWMTREDREHEIRDYVAYLDDVVAHLSADLVAPPPVRILGFSQGAATASRWALLGDTPVDRLVLWAGDLAHDLDLAAHADRLRDLDLTVVVGSRDEWIDDDRKQALLNRLAAHDIDASVWTFDGGHRLDDDTLRRVADDESGPQK
jgi:predicted esterase